MRELEEEWSYEDAATAHDVLDALDEAHARARQEAERRG